MINKESIIKIVESKICIICNTNTNDIKCAKCNIFDSYNYHTLYSIALYSIDYHLNQFEAIKFYCYNNSSLNNIRINYFDKKIIHNVDYLNEVDFPRSIESLNSLYNKIQKFLIFK